jgi:hypothetical protein
MPNKNPALLGLMSTPFLAAQAQYTHHEEDANVVANPAAKI